MLFPSVVLLSLIGVAFGVTCPSEGQYFYPHPTRCHKFIECNDGVAVEQQCFGDLIFNPIVGHCDFKENYPCEDNSEPVGRCPEMNSINTYFLADSENCQTFYLCSWGNPIQMECPLGYHFNPLHWVCDYPDQAGCTAESK